MAQHVPLSVSTREARGTAKNRRLRKAGRVPGVLYQPGGDSLAFDADEYEVRRLIRRGGIRSAVVDLTVDSDAPRTVLFTQWDSDPVRDQIIHLDLQEVDLTVEVEADVPVILVGTAAGVREGGILDQTALTVRVRALPDALPRSIEFDISEVALGDSVHAGDLAAPAGCTIVTEPEYGIASVMVTRAALAADEEEVAEGAEAGEGGEAPAAEAEASAESEGE
ncbi:MAG: 50S ribosomal protein L25 [Acidobacteria bacterium]|nr:50S ribosomal protein L25 [Acidobacteriota bacterium]